MFWHWLDDVSNSFSEGGKEEISKPNGKMKYLFMLYTAETTPGRNLQSEAILGVHVDESPYFQFWEDPIFCW